MRGHRIVHRSSAKRSVFGWALTLAAALAAVLLAGAAAWPHAAAAKKKPKPRPKPPITAVYVSMSFSQTLVTSYSDTWQGYTSDPCLSWLTYKEQRSAKLTYTDAFPNVLIPITKGPHKMFASRPRRDFSHATWTMSGTAPDAQCPSDPPPVAQWSCRGVFHRFGSLLEIQAPTPEEKKKGAVARFKYYVTAGDSSTPDPPDCVDSLGGTHDPLDIFTFRNKNLEDVDYSAGLIEGGLLTRRQVLLSNSVARKRRTSIAIPNDCSQRDDPSAGHRRDTCRQSFKIASSVARMHLNAVVRD